jgi:hypothetical protein
MWLLSAKARFFTPKSVLDRRDPSKRMTKTYNLISVSELKRLLITITDHGLNVSIRFRLVGEMWQSNYMRILKVTEQGVLLNDEVKNKLIALRDLSQVMQFELDSSIHTYQPHFHYDVSPNAL